MPTTRLSVRFTPAEVKLASQRVAQLVLTENKSHQGEFSIVYSEEHGLGLKITVKTEAVFDLLQEQARAKIGASFKPGAAKRCWDFSQGTVKDGGDPGVLIEFEYKPE